MLSMRCAALRQTPLRCMHRRLGRLATIRRPQLLVKQHVHISRNFRCSSASQDSMEMMMLGPAFSNRARLNESVVQSIMELPGTGGIADLRERADALGTWKLCLEKGTLPTADQVSWPQEPFKSKFLEALSQLEMPRFTRRYPAVLNTLVKQMLMLVHDFEAQMLEQQKKKQEQQQQQQQQQQQTQSNQQQQQQQQQSQQQQSGGQAEQGEGQAGEQDMEMSQQVMEEAMKEAMKQQSQQTSEGRELKISLENMEGGKDAKPQDQQGEDDGSAAEMEAIAEEIVKEFKQEMAPVMQNLEAAQAAFDDLSGLMEGPSGFDLSRGTWQKRGWRELDDLRKKLENLKELRELVRSLGRAGGKGPLRRAPEELEASRQPPGMVRSPLIPEEVRGLCRSGELSRMLPSEMGLLAHGWPRSRAVARGTTAAEAGSFSRTALIDPPRSAAAPGEAAAAAGPNSGSSGEDMEGTLEEDTEWQSYYLPGAHAARMLHRVRRAERGLLSYERTGWLEDEPSRVTGRLEIRPAAELGPIIVCLDTSGSMQGARETVAKALALECMRGAHRQQRKCFLYAFSGPGDVKELELSIKSKSMEALLDFLSGSFNGGTDVDAPLQLSLDRLGREEWAQADILMVTDGEIAKPSDKILKQIQHATKELGLEVHGLLVSSQATAAMQELCTHLHVFKSWTAVGGESWRY